MKSAQEREISGLRRIELQLDTAQIVLIVAAAGLVCAACFYLGRWTERDRRSETLEGASSQRKVAEAGKADDLTFFDTLAEGASEPARQVGGERPAGTGKTSAAGARTPSSSEPRASGDRPAASGAPATAEALRARAAPVSGGAGHPSRSAPGTSGDGYALQVFAGDRSQAARVAATLSRKGYAARVVPGTSGARSARVRVYGFASREDAARQGERLKREERLTPWVVKAD